MKRWFTVGFYAHDVLNLTPGESFDMCNRGAALIDVREDYMTSFKMFEVKNLVYLPFSKMESMYDQLPSDQPLIFADSVGLKSREFVLFMKAHGFQNVANMVGGIVDWERDGLPINTDPAARLSGSCMCQLKPRERSKNPNQ